MAARRAFECVTISDRSEKPRERGLTMMIDWGLGLDGQQDLCRLAAPHVDLAKVAVGISGLLSTEVLRRKIEIYRQHQILAFPGGMFLEMAYDQGVWRQYLDEARDVGYEVIEVSDNVVHFDGRTRTQLIKTAVEEYGLRVLGEVGSKHLATSADTLAHDVKDALAAGSWKVFVEAAEFAQREGRDDVLERLMRDVPVDALIFELPGRWIRETHSHAIHTLAVTLIKRLGPEANIGNVSHEDVLLMETLRRGVGVTMALGRARVGRGAR